MRRRFIIALILAILPIALLTSGQAIWRLVRSYDVAQADLKSDAKTTASEEVKLVASAEAVLRTLQSQPDIRLNSQGCSAGLAKALSGTSYYTNIFLLDRTGKVLCSALPSQAPQSDAGDQDWWKGLGGRQGFYLSRLHVGRLTGSEVLTAALPLFDAQGVFDGALAVGIRVDFIRQNLEHRELPAGASAAVLDSSGTIVATGGAVEMRGPFAGIGSPVPGAVLSAIDQAGDRWLVAIEGIGGQDLFLALAERESALFIWSYVDLGVNILLPLVMLALSFGMIWYSADRFVLRWVGYLQRVARAYGKGHLAFRPSAAVKDAPDEIRQLAAAMGDMAESIRQRDASLRNALEQRSLMLREIHHRVKNNLQIIGSLLQIEARNIDEPAALAALKITRTRINAIALAHRLLEEVDAQTVVNLRSMLADLVRLLHDAFGEGIASDGLNVEAPDLLIDTDVAVPLALLLVELLSNIYRDASNERKPALALDVVLDRLDERQLRLRLSHEGSGMVERQNGGPDFAAAYLRQLRASMSTELDGPKTRMTILFHERSADERPTRLG